MMIGSINAALSYLKLVKIWDKSALYAHVIGTRRIDDTIDQKDNLISNLSQAMRFLFDEGLDATLERPAHPR